LGLSETSQVTTISQGTTNHKFELIFELLALTLASKPEKESETHDHDLRDDVQHEGHVVPLATQVGGVEKRPKACKKKEDKEERARRFH
jgi:3,4-dihydroxy-2-butanone 4-phosphate synthase